MAGTELKRLRWRCRRGMRELDLVLESFLDKRGESMTISELETFSQFLDSSDMDLYVWLTGRERPGEPEFQALVAEIGGNTETATR